MRLNLITRYYIWTFTNKFYNKTFTGQGENLAEAYRDSLGQDFPNYTDIFAESAEKSQIRLYLRNSYNRFSLIDRIYIIKQNYKDKAATFTRKININAG